MAHSIRRRRLLSAQNNTIAVPAGFTWTPPLTLKRTASGITTDYDVALRSDIPTGKTYYVATTGNNANAGTTAGSPLRDVSTALAKSDVDVVIIAPGVYHRITGGWKGTSPTRSVSVKGDGTGAVILTDHQEFASGSWTQDATYTNVWSTTRSATYDVLNSTQLDANGDYIKCSTQASVANCNGVPNSRYISGSTVYVNLDGANPSTRAWLLVDNNIVVTGNITVYLEGLTLVGGTAPLIAQNNAIGQNTQIFAKNCNFKFGAQDGIQVKGASLAIFQNCTAAKNSEDGFNYHALNGTQIKAIEINCVGRDNGYSGDGIGNDQGSTAHESTQIVRVNGQYMRNIGGNVVDIDTSQSWMLGCEMHHSSGPVGNNYNFGGITAYLDTCYLHDSTGDIVGNVNVHNTTYSTISGGTATPY